MKYQCEPHAEDGTKLYLVLQPSPSFDFTVQLSFTGALTMKFVSIHNLRNTRNTLNLIIIKRSRKDDQNVPI